MIRQQTTPVTLVTNKTEMAKTIPRRFDSRSHISLVVCWASRWRGLLPAIDRRESVAKLASSQLESPERGIGSLEGCGFY